MKEGATNATSYEAIFTRPHLFELTPVHLHLYTRNHLHPSAAFTGAFDLSSEDTKETDKVIKSILSSKFRQLATAVQTSRRAHGPSSQANEIQES
ncbi:hypothetical protein FALCPG4_001208 [Fusarium falciforme]